MSATDLDTHITNDECTDMLTRGQGQVLGRVERREGRLHRLNAQMTPHSRAKMAVLYSLQAALAARTPALETATQGTIGFGHGFAPFVDLGARVLHQFWTPGDGANAGRETVAETGAIESRTLDGVAIVFSLPQ